jgi:hypothetical protein
MRSIFLCSATLAVVGCASTGVTEVVNRGGPATTTVQTAEGDIDLQMVPETRTITHWIRAPRDTVWATLPAVYSELDITPGTVDEEAGVFGNRDVRATRIAGQRTSRFLDCGRNPIGAPLANTSTVRMEILTRISPSAGGTDVSTTIEARARPRTGGASDVQCTTTGALESWIAERVSALAGVERARRN